jgi:hypothetical protein
MAKQSAFMKQQGQLQRAFFDAGLQSGRQQIMDMLALVLHDPDIMGKDTFGRERLNKVVAAIGKYIDEYHTLRRVRTGASGMPHATVGGLLEGVV